DADRMRRMVEASLPALRQARPDVIGGTAALHGAGGVTQTVYFTTEQPARSRGVHPNGLLHYRGSGPAGGAGEPARRRSGDGRGDGERAARRHLLRPAPALAALGRLNPAVDLGRGSRSRPDGTLGPGRAAAPG